MRPIIGSLCIPVLVLLTVAPAGAAELPFWEIWEHTKAVSNGGEPQYVAVDNGADVLVASTQIGNPPSCTVTKFDPLGGVDWETTFTDECRGVATDPMGNVFALTSPDKDLQVAPPIGPAPSAAHKMDRFGNLLWSVSLPNRIHIRFNEYAHRPVPLGTTIGPALPLYDPTDPSANEIVGLDRQNGSISWSHDLQSAEVLEMVYSGQRFLYIGREVGAGDYFLRALDQSGVTLWTQLLGERPLGLIASSTMVCYSEATYVADNVEIASNHCRSASSGALLWEHVPASQVQQGWQRNHKAFGADGALHVAWTRKELVSTFEEPTEVWKYDASGNLLWHDVYTNTSVQPPLGDWDPVSGIFVDNHGWTLLTVHGAAGGGVAIYNGDGILFWEDLDPLESYTSTAKAAADSLGYPVYTRRGSADPNAMSVRRFGPPYDRWEHDDTWIWAHPWVHPGDPPRYHNFFGGVDDWISFHARAGQTYRISATATGTALPGVQLQLYSANGQTLLGTALPVDLGSNPLTERVWTAPAGGSYHFHLSPIDATADVGREYVVAVTGEQGPSHLWSRQYGVVNSADDLADVVQGPDGSYFVVGDHPGDGTDVGLHHFSKDGLLLSSNHYGGALLDQGRAVAISPAGNPVVAAVSHSFSATPNILLMELAAAGGPPAAVRRYDSGGNDQVYDVQPDPDGGYYLAGSHDLSLSNAVWLTRVASDGEILWSRTFASDDGEGAFCQSMIVGETLVLAGRVGNDGLLMSVSREDGDLLWANRYDAGSTTVWLESVARRGGELVAVGAHYGDGPNLWVLGADSIGDPRWSLEYGPGTGHAIVASADQGFLVAGRSTTNDNGDGWLLGLSADGALLWERAYGEAGLEQFRRLSLGDDGGAIVAGLNQPGSQKTIDLWTMKTGRLGLVDAGCVLEKPTGSVPTDYAVTTGAWDFTENDVVPAFVIDDAVTSGAALSGTDAEQCGLHEPLALTGTLLFATHDTMTWAHWTNEDTFTIYRGPDVTDTSSFSCIAQATLPTYDDTDAPASGEVWFYLIVPDNELGEGPLGQASDGAPRPHPIDCYPPDPI